DPANNNLWNPWAPGGQQSQQLVDKLKATAYTGQTLNGLAKTDVVDGKVTGPAFALPAGAAQYALGFQYRKEAYKTDPSAALVDLWTPQTLGSSEQFDDPATGQTDLQVNALSGGNPTLKPEKSRQSQVGFVLSPIRQFSATVDFFKIRLKDIINIPSAQEVVS